MKRWVKTWLVLAGAYVGGALIITYVVQGGILYPREAAAHLILVPIFQAALLGAVAAAGASGGLRALWRGLRARPLLALVLALDAVVVVSVWLYEEWDWLEDGLPENYAFYYLIPKLAIVGLVLVWRATSERTSATKYVVAIFGCLTLGAALSSALTRVVPLALAAEA